MDPAQRSFVQKQWSKDEINIISATVAFGMASTSQMFGLSFTILFQSTIRSVAVQAEMIRVKHMISQGATEQSPLVSGYNCTNLGSSRRILKDQH
uniref:Uncharacterized protein n=1 Tax=Cucumis melo TaxID=3656 RepID=A0A1S3C1Y0_CUCME